MAGNENILFNVKPYVLDRARSYGLPRWFDDYAAGAGVENIEGWLDATIQR